MKRETGRRLLLPAAALVLLLLLIAVMAGYFSERIRPGLAEREAPETDAGRAGAHTVVQRTDAAFEPVPASVEARETTEISSRLLARITAVHVRAGDTVEQDQLLVSLEDSDLAARVQQSRERTREAQARLTEARRNLERATELHLRGLIAAADLDAARANTASLEAQLASAEQALQEAQTTLGYARIRSPIDGRVVDRLAEPGDTASPGEALLALYNPFSLWIEARVREALALSLREDQVLQVEIPSVKRTLEARIEEIVPAADPGSRSFLVKAALESELGLLPGMYARLRVPAGERSRLLIPQGSVARVGQLDVVWVAAPGGAQRRFVRLGPAAGEELVEVVAGLRAGEEVLPPPAPASEPERKKFD